MNSGLELQCTLKCLGTFPKKSGGRYRFQGLGQKRLFINNQRLLILLDLFLVWWGSVKCSFSVCWVISLFSCLAVINCTANMLDFPEFLHSARSFLYQLDCWAFQGSVFKKQAILNIYLDIIEGQIFYEPMNQLSVFPWLWSTQECHQLCLDQLNSKILETPITQEKF